MLGDHVEVGCGSVLNPGTVIGRNSNIYPLSPVRGCVPADSIYKKCKRDRKEKNKKQILPDMHLGCTFERVQLFFDGVMDVTVLVVEG